MTFPKAIPLFYGAGNAPQKNGRDAEKEIR